MAGGKLPALDGRRIVRALARAGFVIDRIVGSEDERHCPEVRFAYAVYRSFKP
jgi:hypothetical protein